MTSASPRYTPADRIQLALAAREFAREVRRGKPCSFRRSVGPERFPLTLAQRPPSS